MLLTPLVSCKNDLDKGGRQALDISLLLIPSVHPLGQKELTYDPSVQGHQAPHSPSGK